MATSNNNIITHGLSGTVGDMLVFSQRGGHTIVGKTPDRSNVVQSDKQQKITLKFQEAVIYAKAAIADPTTKAAYDVVAKDGQSAYNVAVADFFNAPKIQSIDLSHYTGKVGDTIVVRATDDFKVMQVTVAIYISTGTLIETGNALLGANGLDWVYTAIAANGQLQGDKIVVQASDLPGNMTESQQSM